MRNGDRPKSALSLQCPRCSAVAAIEHGTWHCAGCGFRPRGAPGYLDLLEEKSTPTDEHYTYQWGREKGFFEFTRKNPQITKIMPAGQLGWPQLFETIRHEARNAGRSICVLDAACGFGGIASELVQESTCAGLTYVGADIHHSLPNILAEQPLLRHCGMLLRWDIGEPVPIQGGFDYVICRAAIHHTPDPEKTFRSLCARVKPGGKIAITAYRKKGIAREALDDAFRDRIVPLPVPEAYEAAKQFTVLGKALQKVQEQVEIPEDLELFGIRKGSYSVQSLFYDHFLKCFYNAAFGDDFSTLVNFDWYHPTYAYRYDLPELAAWFERNGLRVVDTRAIQAQYFLLGEKPN